MPSKLIALLLLGCLFARAQSIKAQNSSFETTTPAVYDLSSGWSNSSNPNGPWTYAEGAAALPLIQNWNGAGSTWSGSCNQPAWAPSNSQGQFLPAWFQVNTCAALSFPADPNNSPSQNVLVGDIVVHTNDDANGNTSLGPASVIFTVPASASYTITGMLWNARFAANRPQDWALLLNGSPITSGTLNGTVSRSLGQTFNSTKILNVGDRIEMDISENPSAVFGYFVGLQLKLTASAPATVTKILPQLVFGGGWYTAFYFTNTLTSPASLTVSFISNDGNPLMIPALAGSVVNVDLAARGTAIIEVPNEGPLVQGYAVATLPDGVTGYGVFRATTPGVNDQEAVVPLSGTTATTSTLIFDDTKYVTGVALVNLGSVSTTVTLTVRDNQGNTIGTTAIPMAANAKMQAALRDLVAAVGGAIGSADFTVNTGSLAALGLRFNNLAFTSIPTSDR